MSENSNLNSQAFQILKNSIYNNEFKRNYIYSETKIASKIGISRTPVRDAIHKLNAEGLIDIIPNKGFTVHVLTPEEILSTFEQRCAIEGYCAYRLTLKRLGELEKEIINKLEIYANLQEKMFLENRSSEEIIAEDENFHRTLIYYINNKGFNDFFEQHCYQIFSHCAIAVKSGHAEAETIQWHKKIVSLIKDGTSIEVYKAILNHLGHAQEINYTEALKNQGRRIFFTKKS
ncbi:MAG: GntR family transcriptional regulator [Lachnospiraceae bacterium]|nr:GntR family transcriptional regulator [Lachnospiraceae bacterium]